MNDTPQPVTEEADQPQRWVILRDPLWTALLRARWLFYGFAACLLTLMLMVLFFRRYGSDE